MGMGLAAKRRKGEAKNRGRGGGAEKGIAGRNHPFVILRFFAANLRSLVAHGVRKILPSRVVRVSDFFSGNGKILSNGVKDRKSYVDRTGGK
jgi:hypothetical protein